MKDNSTTKALIFAFIFVLLLPFYTLGQSSAKKQIGSARMSIHLEGATLKDTLLMRYFTNDLFNNTAPNSDAKEISASLINGVYKFKFPVDEQTEYCFIAKKSNAKVRFEPLTDLLQINRGDDVSIHIRIKDPRGRDRRSMFSYSCSGLGAAKYNLSFKVDSILYLTANDISLLDNQLQYQSDNHLRHPLNVALDYLSSKRMELEPLQFEIFRANLMYGKSRVLFQFLLKRFQTMTMNEKILFRKEYMRSVGKVSLGGFSPEILLRSRNAISYFLDQAKATLSIMDLNGSNALYDYLCANYSGQVLEKLLVYYFVRDTSSPSLDVQLKDAMQRVKTPLYKEALKKLQSRFELQTFDKSYNLVNESGEEVSLTSFKNKVVVVDFWFTGCLFCSGYVKERLSKVEEAFRGNPDVVFLSISIDRDKKMWLKSVAKREYTLPTSVNLYTAGLGASHPLTKILHIQGYPSVLLLDRFQNKIAFGPADGEIPGIYEVDQLISNIKSRL